MGNNADTVRGLYESFSKGDAAAVLGAMDDKIQWEEPASVPFENQIGPQAVAENIFGPVTEQIEGFTGAPSEIVDGGDVVCVIGAYSGTGVKTGIELNASSCTSGALAPTARAPDSGVTPTRTFGAKHSELIDSSALRGRNEMPSFCTRGKRRATEVRCCCSVALIGAAEPRARADLSTSATPCREQSPASTADSVRRQAVSRAARARGSSLPSTGTSVTRPWVCRAHWAYVGRGSATDAVEERQFTEWFRRATTARRARPPVRWREEDQGAGC